MLSWLTLSELLCVKTKQLLSWFCLIKEQFQKICGASATLLRPWHGPTQVTWGRSDITVRPGDDQKRSYSHNWCRASRSQGLCSIFTLNIIQFSYFFIGLLWISPERRVRRKLEWHTWFQLKVPAAFISLQKTDQPSVKAAVSWKICWDIWTKHGGASQRVSNLHKEILLSFPSLT